MAARGAGAATGAASDRVPKRQAADDSAWLADAFRQGLKDTGFIEKQNVAIEYRWAGNRWERLDALGALGSTLSIAVRRRHSSATGLISI
jgi:hypothetical protein